MTDLHRPYCQFQYPGKEDHWQDCDKIAPSTHHRHLPRLRHVHKRRDLLQYDFRRLPMLIPEADVHEGLEADAGEEGRAEEAFEEAEVGEVGKAGEIGLARVARRADGDSGLTVSSDLSPRGLRRQCGERPSSRHSL